ncbi:uncharacterized protein F4822DRAFT_401845 [Hypoxylon trugodes]|uniref:uncharacterized protein n=1 Tax=Hypoxylon trugodes TaxID=326681 RepID=UPI0021A23F08|nr:uncharacterized protein F4822DRAFT_401845 [Hypoxylon trugodes]KAI1390408.1 hypothetical protein F4822DRAFT_401845 [Hypoxylon trugodes]
MASQDQQINERHTCLCPDPHDNNLADEYLHYSGCLRVTEREHYLDTLPAHSQQYILGEIGRTEKLRAKLHTHPGSNNAHRLRRFIGEYRKYKKRNPFPTRESGVDGSTGSQNLSADSLAQAPVIFFKDGKSCSIPGRDNHFPRQKFPVEELLTENAATNPLMQHDEEAIRYFHLPANNMGWVEEAIARYYSGASRSGEAITEIILKPELWRAQRCFDSNSEVHARHMKAFCDIIPSSTEETQSSNMVLFMPYLHWETDKGRNRTAEKIEEANKTQQKKEEEENKRASMEMADIVLSHQRQVHPSPLTPTTNIIANASSEEAESSDADLLSAIDLRTRRGRMKLFGLILLTAAEIFDTMDFITEESLITEYLHKDQQAPLHPRRTLDQFYYSSLRSTKTRDRDQVVYRATCQAPPHEGCGRRCLICRAESRKVPRLIMVDQLWLWVLDDNTIITSFPRRWETVRLDTSDVHEAVRIRLENVGRNTIKSAYDIALIVIDECSRVFFDRALDKRPKLVDIFADAIGCIAYKQTAAFDRFLIYSHIVSREFKKGRCHDEATQHILLNIKSECELLKEVMDIIDELKIMIRIMEEQLMVIETFIKQFEQLSSSETSLTASSRKSTLICAKRLQTSVRSRTGEMKTLFELARKSADALKDLLALKQQQASVIEAREAVRNGEEVYKQGQSIMLFTVITIIFLPLSFMSSLFGMNVVQLNSGTLTFTEEFRYMFPIGAGVIVISFFLAFNYGTFTNAITRLLRSAFSFAYNIGFTWLAVRTGWYMMESKITRKTNSLRNREVGITSGMKAEALRNEKNIRQMRASHELIKHMGKEPSISRRSTFSSLEHNSLMRGRSPSSEDLEQGFK